MAIGRPTKRNTGAGRPRKGLDLRKELWEARHDARRAVSCFRDDDTRNLEIPQLELGCRCQLNTDELARLCKYFPTSFRISGQSYLWDISLLRSILYWDDPVIMLSRLVAEKPEWWDALKDAEEHPCSSTQEEAVRNAAMAQLRSGPTVPEDPRLIIHFRRFSENASQRLH